ncbi:wax ester synthase/diacylglycerol acyltransferase 5 [Cannabis sativa]|uniref:Diacylglycerol O-acyltransferase n=1 Tax=Cannabis sativa TaxID=3483 RepID=A0A7J6GNQ2_CANSA|nr:wax ester synthase/diacylglycerol acyltransferase 5 [Cannabis sativa]KAF4384565.1 hypothetical protein F8388_003872 [Cannabis sativa]
MKLSNYTMESEHENGTLIRSRNQALKPIQTTNILKRRGNDDDNIKMKSTFLAEQDMMLMMAEKDEPVSPAGRFFNEQNFTVHILAILGCKTKIFPDVFKQGLLHTLLKHPRFSSLMVNEGGNLKWVRTNVDMDKHVIIADMGDDDEVLAEKFVEDYIYDLTKTSLDKSKPLWEVHIINQKTKEAEGGLFVFKIHHSMGDGMSLVSLLLACTRPITDPDTVPTLPIPKHKQNHNHDNQDSCNNKSSGGFITSSLRWSKGVLWLLQLFWNTLVDIFLFLATGFFLRDSQTPIRAPPFQQSSSPRRIIFRSFSLDDFKLVKNATNSTINDVALGVTQAGLSRYLNRRYGENKNNKDEGDSSRGTVNNLPNNIRLRSVLLVNIRPSPGIQDLADMMEKNGEAEWGNKLGYVLIPLTIDLKEDPLDYIRQVKLQIDRKKHSLEALSTSYISAIVFLLFGIKRMAIFFHKILSGATMGFSNIVGPTQEIGIYGHNLAFLAATTYGQPHELMVNFQSYMKKMTIVLTVDEDRIPDPHQLCNDIEDSLKLIKDTIIERGLVK